MRLTRQDVLPTLFVAAAVGFYALWATDTIAAGMSTRVATLVVLALGIAGCTGAQSYMTEVYLRDSAVTAPIWYAVAASVLGGVAVVSAIIALIWAGEVMLATLVAATAGLWLLATLRHAFLRRSPEKRPTAGRPLQRIG